MPTEVSPPAPTGVLGLYAHPRVAAMLFLGFSAGLPFLLVFSTGVVSKFLDPFLNQLFDFVFR